MATLKEFKQWLEQFPDDTIVQVAIQQNSTHWESYGPVKFKDFHIPTKAWGEGFEFIDLRNNKFIKRDNPHFGKCFLELGEAN